MAAPWRAVKAGPAAVRGGGLRRRLVTLMLLPVLALGVLAVGLVLYWGQAVSREQLLRRATADLAVAHDLFGRVQRDYVERLQSLERDYAFKLAMADGDGGRIGELLAALRFSDGFDFLHVTDLGGRRLFTDGEPAQQTPLLRRAARSALPAYGIEILDAEQLRAESATLAERARFALVPTLHAAPTERRLEERGMVMRVVVPVHDLNGIVVALLDGGVLINRNLSLVDGIRDVVYGPGSLAEGSIGTVTVFLEDVRVSTNVPLRPGERALGTRVSQAVRERVLGEGDVWVTRAFVVNDWYVSAHEPVVDVYGTRVGMLYTGFLEAPYRLIYERALWVSIGVLALGSLLVALAGWLGARRIVSPIERMAATVRAVQAGRAVRIGPLESHDELAELAREFDRMLDLLEQRNAEICHAADRLESKVAERTAELREQNLRLEDTIRLLEQTREQLVSAEKLAALGELTAGVAHEINNPAAVILGNIEVLREELGEALEPAATEVDLIIEQVDRIRAIVDKLLRFARPSAFASAVEPVDLEELVEDTVLLVRHEARRRGLTLRCRHGATGTVRIDRRELQQVLVNLLLNAVQASDEGAGIDVATADDGDDAVLLMVEDEGGGIPPEHLSRIFDPFFTTREVGGVGLGLSVSYALVRAYGGELRARSEVGSGSTFEVWLRRTPQHEHAAAPA